MKHAPIRRRDVRDVVSQLEYLYNASLRKSLSRPPVRHDAAGRAA